MTEQTRGGELAFAAAAVALYVALAAIKMRGYALDGRFWAEEGSMFYADFHGRSWVGRLLYLVYGHLMLAANVVVAASMLVPLKLAPLVTTWLSFAMQSIPVVMIAAWHERIGLTRAAAFAVMVVLAGLPQAPEAWANAVNLHFHFSLVAAIIAAAGTGSAYPRWTSRGLLALSGLSGVPPNFLAPLFLALAVVTRERERWIHFGILAATAAIQGLLLLIHSDATGERTLSFDPRFYWLPIVAQQVLSPLLGTKLGEGLATILRRVLQNDAGAVVFAMACSVPIAGLFAAAWRARARRLWTLLAASLTLALLSIFGSIGDKMSLISAAGGGRYFYVPNVLLAMFLFSAFGSSRRVPARVFLAFVLVVSLVHVPSSARGPDWIAAYDRAMAERAAEIDIWPAGWKMRNVLLEQARSAP
jgi:hypothetical protein